MMNRWGIPAWLEEEVKARDKVCVYCGVQMIERMPQGGSRRTVATWEHIINDASIVTPENIARCCSACNSSKGTKDLADWMKSNYCKKRGINKDTVAEIVKQALKNEDQADTYNVLQRIAKICTQGKATLTKERYERDSHGKDIFSGR